jgi:hypothetical protein
VPRADPTGAEGKKHNAALIWPASLRRALRDAAQPLLLPASRTDSRRGRGFTTTWGHAPPVGYGAGFPTADRQVHFRAAVSEDFGKAGRLQRPKVHIVLVENAFSPISELPIAVTADSRA